MSQLMVTTSELNVRDQPSEDGAVVATLHQGDVVDWVESSADGGWRQIQSATCAGWSSSEYLSAVAAPTALAVVDPIVQIAAASPLTAYQWKNRGTAPVGYIKGMALTFGRVYCKYRAGDPCAAEMAKANTGDGAHDALAWFDAEFAALGMDNSADGPDTLRHLFVLMLGLGMRESSGIYCTGRDQSASNTSANTAEAGLFQTSFNASGASPLLPALFQEYLANPAGFLDVFQEGVAPCNAANLQNFGDGDGAEFQRLSKSCPAFAAEFAAVALRNLRTHWGPINMKTAEINADGDAMLQQVQQVVDANGLCGSL
jgi:hypothetical protein